MWDNYMIGSMINNPKNEKIKYKSKKSNQFIFYWTGSVRNIYSILNENSKSAIP